ncbi:hypothetical protein Dimus_032074 [Dionaea muscipula]
MLDNGLNNVMELIKRQKWEKQFKRRELVHVDAVKEFYARLTLIHYKKKEVVRSSVRGVEIEFDHMRFASILVIPGNNGIYEYIKDNVLPRFGKRDTTSYMDLIYIDHLTARRLVNLPRVMMRRMSYVISVKDHELSYGDWMTMVRRDDEEVAPAEAVNEEDQNQEFDWEAVVDEAADQGESGSNDKFYDAQVDVEEPVVEAPTIPAFPASPRHSTNQQKEPEASGVDPSGPSGHIPDSVMSKLQAEFERDRANKIQADLEKAQAENARLLALLQQAQSQPKP